ncbi:MAG: hypothetical protein QM703_24420 [Gemmatales bacterium]
MCLLMIFGGMILLIAAIFVKSALVLLPWTISAGVLAGLSGVGLGKVVGRTKVTGATISVLASFALTIVFGYLGYWLITPPGAAPKQGLEQLLTMPEPTQKDLLEMLPIHLVIVGIITAIIVSRVWYRWSPDLNLLPDPAGTGTTPEKDQR